MDSTDTLAFSAMAGRVKDPQVSLAVYSHVFGMEALRKLDFPDMQFSLYFPARLEGRDDVPQDAGARPEQGKMKGVAFVRDPDGYWIEIVQADLLAHLGRSTPIP